MYESTPDPYEEDGIWVVDLSQGDTRNPDCLWIFSTKAQASIFIICVSVGIDPREAAGKASGYFC